MSGARTQTAGGAELSQKNAGSTAADLREAPLMNRFEVVHEGVMAGDREQKFALFEARKA